MVKEIKPLTTTTRHYSIGNTPDFSSQSVVNVIQEFFLNSEVKVLTIYFINAENRNTKKRKQMDIT